MITLPGLIDPHVHFRTPGQSHKEDFTTGTKAAIAGGFTAVLDMPNNLMPATSKNRLNEKIKIAKKDIFCDVGFHFGSLSDNLDEFKEVDGKVFGLKLYLNKSTRNLVLDKENLLLIYKSWKIKKPVLVHAEADILDSVIEICEQTNKNTHICHVSSGEELTKIIKAKKKGVKITCGVTPHHLFLKEKDVKKLGSFGKMKPPVHDGFSDYAFNNLAYIDCIESDHAPHTIKEKKSEDFPYGVPNLDTTLGLLLTATSEGLLTFKDIKRLCHDGPAKIFGIKQNAKILVDENEEWIVHGKDLFTKCKWSPFEGRKLRGRVKKVYIRNKLVFENGKFLVKPGFGEIIQLKINDKKRKTIKMNTPFYDPELSYEENYIKGPFGEFANKKVFKEVDSPKYLFVGLPVRTPFGIPAGPLINSKFVNAALDKGFDIVEYKTVRSRKLDSHSWPNVLSVKIQGDLTEKKAEKGLIGHHEFNNPPSITNSFGVPSMDPDVWQKDIALSVKHAKKGQIVIGSFQGTLEETHEKYIKDFVHTSKLVKETGVKCMEVNFSCPNEGHGNFLCFDINRSRKIAYAIKNEIGNTPLIVKVSYFHNRHRLGKFVYELGQIVDGIAAINTLPAKVIDDKGMQVLPGEGRIKSGVCGDAIRWAGLQMVKRLKSLRDEFDYSYAIVGVGGVLTPEHYLRYRKFGADAVMSATGAMWNPYLAQEIKELT